MKKHIVTIGGGHGQSMLLAALRHEDIALSAIVSVFDSGGSSGVLGEEYHILPPGDLRRCVTALSPLPGIADIWNYRFASGHLQGHTVGNIVLTSAFLQSKDPQEAIDRVGATLHIEGRVFPVSDHRATLIGELDNGTIVAGEHALDVPQHDARLHIRKLWLEPSVSITAHVRRAISSADYVVVSMGDLFTSILPNLLVGGLCDLLAKRGVPIVAICNRTTKAGETHEFTTQDFFTTLQSYLAPARLHTLVVDNGVTPVPRGTHWLAHHGDLPNVRVIVDNFADPEAPQWMSGEKVARVIRALW